MYPLILRKLSYSSLDLHQYKFDSSNMLNWATGARKTSIMNLQNTGSRKFKVNVNGGHVLCGDNSRMDVTYRRRGDRARIRTMSSRSTDAKITGPDQLVSTIPYRVYSQLTTLLARDRINIAGRLFNLTLEEAMSLRDNTTCDQTSMDAVFQLMKERHVKLGQLVQVLDEMQRFDALSVITEAGYPDRSKLHPTVSEGIAEEELHIQVVSRKRNQTYSEPALHE